MKNSIILHPTIEQTANNLLVLVAEINRWITIEGTIELATGAASAQCGQEIADLRRALLKKAGDTALEGELLLASLLTGSATPYSIDNHRTIQLATQPSVESAKLFRSIGLLCAPDRNAGLDEKIQKQLTSIFSKASLANDLGDAGTLRVLRERAKVVLSGANPDIVISESIESLRNRVASLQDVLTHLQDSIKVKTAFGVGVFEFFDHSSQTVDVNALQQRICLNIKQMLASLSPTNSGETVAPLPLDGVRESLELTTIDPPEIERNTLIPLSISDQREALSVELSRAVQKAASWAQFLKHRDISCSELILRDASGLNEQGFRFSWHPFDRFDTRPKDLPADFALLQIERELSGRGLIMSEALNTAKSLSEYPGVGGDATQQVYVVPPSIMFWMNPRGEVQLLEEDDNQSSLTGMRMFLKSIEDIISCAAPMVSYWNEFSDRKYSRSGIPILVGALRNHMSELDEPSKAIVSIARSLVLLKAPRITERTVTKELWVSGQNNPDDDLFVEFYSHNISLGANVQVPFPKNDHQDEQTPQFGVTFIFDDEKIVDHYRRLLRAREVTFSGSLRVNDKPIACRCTLKGPPLFEYLSTEPNLSDERFGVAQWNISFGDITISSEDLNDDSLDDLAPILQALAEVIPSGFTSSKITFYDNSSRRLSKESVEYFPGILMKPEE
jgi:hypothetical protein